MREGTVRLILVRHGEVEANRSYQYLGRRDDELNGNGLAQADALATALSELAFDAVVSSPLKRTRETARRLAAPSARTVLTDDRLIELDFGSWEGRTRSQLIATSPESASEIEAWEADPSRSTPGGESLLDLQRRVVDLVDELAREREGSTVVLVSHMGPIKVLLCAALQLPLESAGRIFLDPATISVVDWGPGAVVRLVNSHAHLGFAGARWLQHQ